MNSPITKRCFVILSATKNLLFRCCFRDPSSLRSVGMTMLAVFEIPPCGSG